MIQDEYKQKQVAVSLKFDKEEYAKVNQDVLDFLGIKLV